MRICSVHDTAGRHWQEPLVEPSRRFRRLSDVGRLAWVVGTALLLVFSACSGAPSNEVTNVRMPAIPTATSASANLTLIVINAVDREDRIRVEINGHRAIDATFPASAARSHPPIFEYRYAVPGGTTTIRVTTPSGTEMLRVATTTTPNWVVVQNQSEAVGTALDLYTERPAFG